MERNQSISKEELQKVLADWGRGHLSSEKLQMWMELNYFPLHLKIAPNEPQHTQKAMHIIMNEFELANPNHFVSDCYKIALIF